MEAVITQDPSFRNVLPPDFLWGVASASYQIEGGWNANGKGPSVYDHLWQHRENGEVACDSYHLWKEDVQLLKKYGVNCYRFSVSWPRVIPSGGAEDPVNEAGLAYYSNLIDALLEAGITPVVTIYHWDLPLPLFQKYGGFYDKDAMSRDFVRYARLLFETFGDRVKDWITINEPHIIFSGASHIFDGRWNPDTDIPRFTESLLLCHAKVVKLYRNVFQPTQRGKIGITLDIDWVEPFDDSTEAKKMAEFTLESVCGLFAGPIFHGRFPQSVLEDYGDLTPKLTEDEWNIVRDSSDFFGLNHYGSSYATGRRHPPGEGTRMDLISGRAERVFERDGVPIGSRGVDGHPHDVPWGFRKLLQYIHTNYTVGRDIPIMITENGTSIEGEDLMSRAEAINDVKRQTYYAGYLKELIEAARDDGILIGGYMAWSFLDNLEWTRGWRPRFGLTVVDREDGCKRYPKDSAFMLGRIFRHAVKG
ncbi:uncharacterized protein L199_004821 [Kwoniella botswanensis]|uniref:uncharacterized protein n=1 Tax=Kwoniella botswanensis TaxID=1268659 RepID=UPI00315C8001